MVKNIAFFVAHFTERGSEVAIFDYAYNNEKILGNKSYIICFSDDLKNRINFATWVSNKSDTYEKFSRCFEILEVNDINEVRGLVERYKLDFFHFLTHGGYIEKYFQLDNRDIWGPCKTIKHCVFMMSEIEGDYLISISDYLIHKYNRNIPVIPHIVNLPEVEGDLREQLGIPKEGIVLGRYGGISEFNVDYMKEGIIEFLKEESNVYFLFMNTYRFVDHPRVIHLERNVELDYKVRFINTCDAMIHGRNMGETFGLSIAEFSVKNKPVITCPCGDLEHYKILGEKGIFYRSKEDLLEILRNVGEIIGGREDWNAYRYYTGENVMRLFDELIFSN